jgi:hypothetical protein
MSIARPRPPRSTVLSAVALAALTLISPVARAQNRVVNMIPQSRSGETNQDSEPTLAIDPADYSRLAGSAFTWDNLTQSAMTTATAPIYVSSDRGASWTLAFIVPSKIGSSFPTGDINLNFGTTLSGSPLAQTGWLYGGTLSATSSSFPVQVLRSQDFLDPAQPLMTVLDTRTGNVDQPHVAARSDSGGLDKLYVGFNNGYGCGAPSGETSTLDVSQSAAAASPTLGLELIEARTTSCQDGFAQVPAPHQDGTVYAAFLHDWNGTPRMVVVRDDAWGAGTTPFTALTDPSDSKAGRFVTTALTVQSGTMGQQRLGASNISIAVDPRNSDRVYLAYGDSGGASLETIHVRRSIDRGVTWSGDLLTVTSAMNPEVAISATGQVGLLYQKVASSRWQTHLDRTTDPDATTFDDPGVTLANTDATTPSGTIASNVYVGDYASLRAAGKNFMGMFTASNYPDTANFLPGVVFQRFADWGTHTLYADAAHTTPVGLSMDPYFFEIDGVAQNLDIYVRDWTADPTHGDSGVEPSTNPVFYATSDVWNQRSSTPKPFVNDQPQNDDAGNGAGSIGDNWAYARVRRNVTGPALSVTAHFLVSKFGTGSNFADSSTGDPDIAFDPTDPVIAADTSAGPWISTAYHWHLNAIAGNHLCLAVEISAPGSPYIPPTLAGQAPGWPTTDLRIVTDNHKAQRNMQLTTVPASGSAGGSVTNFAIIHNAATFTRDMTIAVAVEGVSKRYIRSAVIGGTGDYDRKADVGPGGSLVLRAMRPGENRWVSVQVEAVGAPAGVAAYVVADEVVGGVHVNGFGVGVRPAPLEEAEARSLDLWRQGAQRLAAVLGARASAREGAASLDFGPARYLAFVKTRIVPAVTRDLAAQGLTGPDDFGLPSRVAALASSGSAEAAVLALNSLMNALDARITQIQLTAGDAADIQQMVRWQRDLFHLDPRLSRTPCAPKVVEVSSAFLKARAEGKTTNSAGYPKLVDDVKTCLMDAAGAAAPGPLAGASLAELEGRHRAFLMALAGT